MLPPRFSTILGQGSPSMTHPLPMSQNAEEKVGPFQQTPAQGRVRAAWLLHFVFKTIRQDLDIGNWLFYVWLKQDGIFDSTINSKPGSVGKKILAPWRLCWGRGGGNSRKPKLGFSISSPNIWGAVGFHVCWGTG